MPLIKYINKSLASICYYKRTNLSRMLSVKGHNIIPISNTNPQSKSTARPIDKPPLPKKSRIFTKVEKTVKVLKHEYVSDERRENILDARFVRKKQQLLNITRQNVRLFQKINSQKSVYSHESLHKSFESNKSLNNSRMTNRTNKSLKKSQISNSSKISQKSTSNSKNTFFNRATSAKSNQNLPTANKIIIKDTKRKSMVNLKPKRIQETAQEDIQQFAGLFNIKQEPSLKQRNRPVRIRSTNPIKPLKTVPTPSRADKKFSQSKQIVINEENEIEIHEEIDAENWDTFRAKCSRAQSARMKRMSVNQNIPQQIIGSNQALQQDTQINILPCQTQQCLKSSKKSQQSQNSASRKRLNRQNIENLFEIKNSGIKSRLLQKIGNQKVSTKYANLISKINTQLNKHVKKAKETSLYPFKSRLIA